MATTYAWCFDHGLLHQFSAEPWCTASWVPFAVSTKEQALKAKVAAYGDAQFFDQLTSEQQLEVIEIRDAWRPVETDTHSCANCGGDDPDTCLHNGAKEGS